MPQLCAFSAAEPLFAYPSPVVLVQLSTIVLLNVLLLQQKQKLYKTDNGGIDNRCSANSAGRSSKHSYAAFSHDKTATSSIYACLLQRVGIAGETPKTGGND
jgi:hypothetical protein